jgi:hypothetical protein
MMNNRQLCLGVFGLSLALCATLTGCPKQDAQYEAPVEALPKPPVEALCNSDTQCDDGNPCTMNSCDGATLKCVALAIDNVGTPMAPQSECLKHVCTMGVDTTILAPDGTAISAQVAGDCRKAICDGAGGVIEINDDTDVNIDGLACTLDVCTGGVATNPNAPSNTPCGNGLTCNGNGQCEGCATNADCAAEATACTIGVCNSGVCQLEPKASGTVLPPQLQVGQDCQVLVCNGAGSLLEELDTSDPTDDGNPCTTDTCSGATTVHTPKPAGTQCMGNLLCNGAGTCGGSNGDTCTTNAACLGGHCVDGACCNTACTTACMACNVPGSMGTCTNTPFYQPDGACGGTTVCDGNGACKIANGEKCTGGADNCASGVCVATFCKALAGQPCTTDKDCAGGTCTNGSCE